MRALVAIFFVAMLLFGCVNISDTAKAASFGKKKNEQKAYDYFVKKYGDPTGPGAPRIIGVIVTSAISDSMPADVVKKYSKSVPALHAWFFYDNFGENDPISVAFKYLDDNTVIHTFNSRGGGDYGAGTFTLNKPDDGWPTGKYSVTVSGKGVSESYEFEVIEGKTVSSPLPYDENGAKPAETGSSANPEGTPSPLKTPSDAVLVFDSTNHYIGGCSLTDTASFKLQNGIDATILQTWYNWAQGENTITFTMSYEGSEIASGTMVRADCDPYQKSWCNGNYDLNKKLMPGNYVVKVSSKKMCLDPSTTGGIRIYGKKTGDTAATTPSTGGTTATPAAPSIPAGTPSHLAICSYTGSWNTDWGAMKLQQDGSKITGTYTHDSGKLSGTLVDGVFVGKWSEAPSYSEPGDGGDAVFYFTKDCNSFSGSWHYGVHTSGGWSGSWVGTKTS